MSTHNICFYGEISQNYCQTSLLNKFFDNVTVHHCTIHVFSGVKGSTRECCDNTESISRIQS